MAFASAPGPGKEEMGREIVNPEMEGLGLPEGAAVLDTTDMGWGRAVNVRPPPSTSPEVVKLKAYHKSQRQGVHFSHKWGTGRTVLAQGEGITPLGAPLGKACARGCFEREERWCQRRARSPPRSFPSPRRAGDVFTPCPDPFQTRGKEIGFQRLASSCVNPF